MEVNVYGEVHVHAVDEPAVQGKSLAEMALIKRSVKNRDDNKCQVCGETDKPLECHHINTVSKHPELEADLSNIITLCQSCHRSYHNKFERAEGPVSFAKFMRDYGGDFK